MGSLLYMGGLFPKLSDVSAKIQEFTLNATTSYVIQITSRMQGSRRRQDVSLLGWYQVPIKKQVSFWRVAVRIDLMAHMIC